MTEPASPTNPGPETISSGSNGLDDILGGGFDSDRVYLIEGRPKEVVPFILGFAYMKMRGDASTEAIFVGAAMVATGVRHFRH